MTPMTCPRGMTLGCFIDELAGEVARLLVLIADDIGPARIATPHPVHRVMVVATPSRALDLLLESWWVLGGLVREPLHFVRAALIEAVSFGDPVAADLVSAMAPSA